MAVFCFASYALAGNVLTTTEAYTALALFNLLSFPLTFLPFAITMIIDALVGSVAAGQRGCGAASKHLCNRTHALATTPGQLWLLLAALQQQPPSQLWN